MSPLTVSTTIEGRKAAIRVFLRVALAAEVPDEYTDCMSSWLTVASGFTAAGALGISVAATWATNQLSDRVSHLRRQRSLVILRKLAKRDDSDTRNIAKPDLDQVLVKLTGSKVKLTGSEIVEGMKWDPLVAEAILDAYLHEHSDDRSQPGTQD